MPEFHSRIPDGIPDPARQGVDRFLAVVHEHEIEVGVRSEIAAPVTADGHEGATPTGGDLGDRRIPDLGEPRIGGVREFATKTGPAQGLVLEDRPTAHRDQSFPDETT